MSAFRAMGPGPARRRLAGSGPARRTHRIDWGRPAGPRTGMSVIRNDCSRSIGNGWFAAGRRRQPSNPFPIERQLALRAARCRGVVPRAPADLGAEPDQRIVLAADDALLQRNQRVVGDLDVLGADLGAALGDVAVAEAEVVLRDLPPVRGVGRVHLEFSDPHQEPGPGERALVLRVVPDHVAGVLAQEALDALAELLRPVDVDLLHPELAEP